MLDADVFEVKGRASPPLMVATGGHRQQPVAHPWFERRRAVRADRFRRWTRPRVTLRSMDRSDAAQSRHQSDGRSTFDKFVEAAYQRVSRAPFFFVCAGIVVVWMASLPLWVDLKAWQVAIHTVTSVLSLLLLVLLENASRRAEEASQEKLNVLAEALAALMESRAQDDPNLHDSVRSLREAIGLEERH